MQQLHFIEHLIEAFSHPQAFINLISVVLGLLVVGRELRKKNFDIALYVFVVGLALAFNSVVVNVHIFQPFVNIPSWIKAANLVSLTFVLPVIYLALCKWLGMSPHRPALSTMFGLLALNFIPSLIMNLTPDAGDLVNIRKASEAMYLYVYSNNALVYGIAISSIIILAQVLVCVSRLAPVFTILRRYGLQVTPEGRSFMVWLLLILVVAIGSAAVPMSAIATPVGSWLYNGSYFIVVNGVFIMFLRGIEMHPLQDEEGNTTRVEDVILGIHEMAERARMILIDKQYYLQPGFSLDDFAAVMGTNRTYIGRMMKSEFGMSYSDFVMHHRMIMAVDMLQHTTLSVESVATSCGFSDTSTFIRAFKRAEQNPNGLTPLAFRHVHLGKKGLK